MYVVGVCVHERDRVGGGGGGGGGAIVVVGDLDQGRIELLKVDVPSVIANIMLSSLQSEAVTSACVYKRAS